MLGLCPCNPPCPTSPHTIPCQIPRTFGWQGRGLGAAAGQVGQQQQGIERQIISRLRRLGLRRCCLQTVAVAQDCDEFGELLG